MPLFWRTDKSDTTAFSESLKSQKPALEDEQRQGRALLWDKAIDPDAQDACSEAREPQQPCVNQTEQGTPVIDDVLAPEVPHAPAPGAATVDAAGPAEAVDRIALARWTCGYAQSAMTSQCASNTTGHRRFVRSQAMSLAARGRFRAAS